MKMPEQDIPACIRKMAFQSETPAMPIVLNAMW